MIGLPCMVAEVYKKSGHPLEAWLQVICAFCPVIITLSSGGGSHIKFQTRWKYLTLWNIVAFLVIMIINNNASGITSSVAISSLLMSNYARSFLDVAPMTCIYVPELLICNILFERSLQYTELLGISTQSTQYLNGTSFDLEK